MDEGTSEPEAAPDREEERRPRVKILIAFLVAFLLLLVAFRRVLFPFLMAIFVAYLIEPVVAALTRSPIFGVRWTRGPAIVLMYVVALGGAFVLGSRAVAHVARSVKEISRDVARALDETAERARFALVVDERAAGAATGERDADPGDRVPPYERDLRIPRGTRVVIRPSQGGPRPASGEEPAPLVFTTLYDVVIPAGETAGRVLLTATSDPLPADDPSPGRILDLGGIRFADGDAVPDAAHRLRVAGGDPAMGLEVLVERRLITPIVENLERAGYHVQPTDLRDLLSTQARAFGEGMPDRVAAWGRHVVTGLAFSIYEFLLILMLTAFIVMDRKRIATFFATLPPPRYRAAYQGLVRYVDRGLAGVIRGQLAICAVNGVLTYLGLLLFQVQGAGLLSLIAGIFSLIPVFGTILSTVPIVLLAATDGIDKGLLALGWILLIHLLEANLLNPLIMGSHARMHPVIIIFALLAGEHAFGIWGALLAVPTMSIIQSCFHYYRHEIEGLPHDPPPPHRTWLGRILGGRRETGAPGAESA